MTNLEVPFPARPECVVSLDAAGAGYITFTDPRPEGGPVSIPVHTDRAAADAAARPVWHLELTDDGHAVTRPSIHAVGWWHTPNPTVWRVVEELG